MAFEEVDPTIGQLWFQQIFKKKFGFRIGKYNPVPAYDFFPMKNFRTDFVDGIHAANVIIPLPSRGLGGYIMYGPKPLILRMFLAPPAGLDASRLAAGAAPLRRTVD